MWKDIVENAKIQKSFKERFNISTSYISEKIGESEETIEEFFSLNWVDIAPEEQLKLYYKYLNIRFEITELFKKMDLNSSPVNPDKIWNDIIKSAKELNKFKKHFNFSYSYMSEQTGEPEEKIKMFFAMDPDSRPNPEFPDKEEYLEYEKLRNKIKELFEKEKNSNGYTLLDDDEFYEIHELLINEFKIKKNKLANLLKEKVSENETEEFYKLICELNIELEYYKKIKNDFYNPIYEIPEEQKNKFDIRSTEAAELIKGKSIEKEIRKFYSLIETINHSLISYEDVLENGLGVLHNIDGKWVVKLKPLAPSEYYENKILSMLLKSNMESAEREYANILGMYRYHKKSRQNIDRRTIAQPNFTFTADQQKSLLEIYFERCVDDKGYLLPEHLGSGIQLAFYLSDYDIKKDCLKIFVFPKENNAEVYDKVYNGIQKIREWIPYNRQNEYDFGDTADKTETYDAVYEFIYTHKRVFFYDPLIKNTYELFQKIRAAPKERQRQLYDLLNKEFKIGIPMIERAREESQTVSEYWAIMSNPPLVETMSKYSRNEIYRIVYDISKNSGESIPFSYNLCNRVLNLSRLKAKHWRWQIFIANYYANHNEIDSLFKYIETK